MFTAALIAWFASNVFMIATGVNGIRYARLLHLRIGGYAPSVGWLFFGTLLSVAYVLQFYRIILEGIPPNANLNLFSIIWIFGGTPITAAMMVASYIGVRNARALSAERREELRKLKNEVSTLRRVRTER